MANSTATKLPAVSSRAKRGICFFVFLLGISSPALLWAKEKPRPKIFGIYGVRLFTTNKAQADPFYRDVWGALSPPIENADPEPCNWCERVPGMAGTPAIETIPLKKEAPSNLIGTIIFRTDNAENLRNLLRKNKIKAWKLETTSTGTRFFVLDPERHCLEFLQTPESIPDPARSSEVPATVSLPLRLIHVGFVVKNRAAMDHFYKDILGFRLYWQGGMKDGDTDWVDMQVPDGTSWIEYMLNVPAAADKRELGVMNHIALGVTDIKAADSQLLDESKAKLRVDQPPQIGRDGKWQLNLYDPDGTRIELMEFTPVEKPCCSEYTGPHPKP